MITFKLITIATLLTTIFVLQSCGRKHHDDDPADPSGDQTALKDPDNDKELRLRGYVELSSLVETSLLKTEGEFSFQKYLGGEINFFAGPIGLTPVLGYYSADPASPGWKNVTANTISIATHLVAFDELATDIAKYCENTDAKEHKAILKDSFKEIAVRYCTSPQLSEGEFKEIWHGLTAYLVPETEFQPWLENLRTAEGKPYQERFQIMVTTAMTSPWLIFKN